MSTRFALVTSLLTAGLLLCVPQMQALADDPVTTTSNGLISLHADQVQFYYDRFVIDGDGNVKVDLPGGVKVSGDTFSMDLRLHRFLVAGNVTVVAGDQTLHGAAMSDFLSFRRVYFVPVTDQPDRWTYLDGDFAHPQKGREMPDDAFFFPDLGGARPFIRAQSAVIDPDNYATFRPASIDTGIGYLPTPVYVLNFSTNPNIEQNSLSGASFDAPYPFAGNAHTLSAVHFRYDTFNKTYFSFEQHFANDRSYVVFSLNPATRPSKFWNLLTSDRFAPQSQVQTFTQLHTFQSALSMPVESSQYTNLTLTQGLHRSYLQYSVNFYNQSLLDEPPLLYFQNPSHAFNAAHPVNMQLTWTTFDERIGHLPLYERFRIGGLYAHDIYGIQGYATPSSAGCSPDPNNPSYCNPSGQPFGVGQNLWQNLVGLTLYTPSVKLGNNSYLNAVFDKQRTWGAPHYVDTTDTKVSASKLFGTHAVTYLQYDVRNVSDVYGRNQLLAYPPYVPVVDGTAYPGFAAFVGLATYRTLTGGFALTPNPDFALAIFARKHTDFPASIPFYYGTPPYDLNADLRIRIAPHTMLDISRTYYFNFANERWSPYFQVQVLP
ncbi:MAG: hypothetical protein JO193_02480 [Candidatus Eremiobacteraeota bacterium]|nr:hypothetical protein [Candidatus Eremiobacteraeota bacterium]